MVPGPEGYDALSVAVVDNGRTRFAGAGAPVGPDTAFENGSVTKVFTGMLWRDGRAGARCVRTTRWATSCPAERSTIRRWPRSRCCCWWVGGAAGDGVHRGRRAVVARPRSAALVTGPASAAGGLALVYVLGPWTVVPSLLWAVAFGLAAAALAVTVLRWRSLPTARGGSRALRVSTSALSVAISLAAVGVVAVAAA